MAVNVLLIVQVGAQADAVPEMDANEWTMLVTLPFAPWIGMNIRDNDGNRDPHTIEELEWELGKSRFVAFCEAEEWDSTAEQIRQEMSQNGWV